jgi:elongation factor P
MVKAGQIAKGACLIWKGQPFMVTEREFVNPGKGSAFVRLKLKNLRSGSVLRETLKSNDSVEEADVFDRDGQYLYADDTSYQFMDSESYEQFIVPREGLEEKVFYMKEGETYRVIMWEATPIDVSVPLKIVLEVTEAEEGVRGDTVTGATKPVRTETGLEVRVPIFIKQGDKILVNTETGDYVERVNE